MPTLILSSRYTTESKVLRKAAEALQWQTLRLEDDRIPAWYEEEIGMQTRQGRGRAATQHAIYCTVPTAFRVAKRLGAILLGCSSDWLVKLPEEFLRRKVELFQLNDVLGISGTSFIKPALGKSFDAAVRTGPSSSLGAQTSHLPADLLVHVSEVVEWEAEYRCFIRQKEVLTLSVYRRRAITFASYDAPLTAPRHELDAATAFAASVVNAVPCPAAFVLDVGLIKGRGWAVVEPNECWGAGIYGCDPAKVMPVLLAATVATRDATEEDRRWDYAQHYFRACPHMREG